MCTVWHVDKYKITFKLVINHWTNEILWHILVSEVFDTFTNIIMNKRLIVEIF